MADGEYVELSVKDNGCGMPSPIAERAFEPFFTTKEVGRGTGLGLSQVYGTVVQSGGGVRIESTEGAGTTVLLYLRRAEPTTEQSIERDDPLPTAAPPGTILVIDDDPDVRDILSESLTTLGYTPVLTEDGGAALAELDRLEPEAMIIDFAMPGMNGAEVARRARTVRPNIPIVLASGYSESAALDGLKRECTRLLRKPFKIIELQSAP
ncbi:response regulator [Bradyrhizobium guangdongense]